MTTVADRGRAERAEGAGKPPLRFVTAASLFDGHDAAINVMRRLIQDSGAEVVHLGHNRSVRDVVRAAIQEDADAIAISSYQGGHTEYFRYAVEMLREAGADHIRVFGGGGGTITPEEIADLEAFGVERIYHPHDGMSLGLVGMIDDLVERAATKRVVPPAPDESRTDDLGVARLLSALEDGAFTDDDLERLRTEWTVKGAGVPVVGVTGTGGAGKSTVTDELLSRFVQHLPDLRIAVLAVDPTRRRTGGALLGDRIRMNSLRHEQLYMRSMATRRQNLSTSAVLADAVAFLRAADFDLVIVETAGIGQSDSEIVDLVDLPVYVMTSEFGAASQLEKIDMLDLADLVVINKFDKQGAADALRDVRKQWRRNRAAFELAEDEVPVYPTIASQFADPGVTWMFVNLCRALAKEAGSEADRWDPGLDPAAHEPRGNALIPGQRVRYLAEIAEQGRGINAKVEELAASAAQAQHLYEALRALHDAKLPPPLEAYAEGELTRPRPTSDSAPGDDAGADPLPALRAAYDEALTALGPEAVGLLRGWDRGIESVTADTFSYEVRGREITGPNYRETLSHQQVPKIAPPRYEGWGERLRFLMKENLPGSYPYTGGVFPYRREGEDPTRMFAGEGSPERTNRRFHYLSQGQPAKRLSTAFDSVTLYGEDPDERPDIYGKVGNSGVSIATLDDAKKLYSGFDLCAPTTSVSMTINGPAPIVLAFFLNAAIDQQVEKHLKESGRWVEAEKRLDEIFGERPRPRYKGELPPGNDGLGLGLLGVSGADVVDAETYAQIRAETLRTVRGTVQADILKEDQAQNTCIFSTEFAMKMMGDVQEFFVAEGVRNFYSVSISGYHIAEAGANPISQLAFTLANGFTIVEYYLARGMEIDSFAPNLSFFFSNGMDPEYAVIGRVARRIWARAMRERYGASERSQMLKYHIQTSGRSLHAQEISFNDIRTTLQALYAIFDNCNSLHTNAYDEAITTPTEESVRRAVAIQLIINRELGLNFTENPWQGSFAIEALTDLVEAAVYEEFERISERGGVLGAMDTMYQRGRIQEESMYYERRKHDGTLPLIGVNTFLPEEGAEERTDGVELMRSTDTEKDDQIASVRAFQALGAERRDAVLGHLREVARERDNVFEALMDAVKVASLGQVSGALYTVGGEYRRNM